MDSAGLLNRLPPGGLDTDASDAQFLPLCPEHSPLRPPRTCGDTPCRKTTLSVHHRPIGPEEQKQQAPDPKATAETKGQRASQEGGAKGTNAQNPQVTGRAHSSTGGSQGGKPAEVRTEKAPDAGAQGTTTPHRPGKAGRGQETGHLQGLPEPHGPGPDQVRNLRRETPANPKARRGTGYQGEEPVLGPSSVPLTTPEDPGPILHRRKGSPFRHETPPWPTWARSGSGGLKRHGAECT